MAVALWREIDDAKVWYEWCLRKPCASHVHNIGGRSYTVGR